MTHVATELAFELGREHKELFLDAARAICEAGIERGLPHYVWRASIVNEALMVAAAAHPGDLETFIGLAVEKMQHADRVSVQ